LLKGLALFSLLILSSCIIPRGSYTNDAGDSTPKAMGAGDAIVAGAYTLLADSKIKLYVNINYGMDCLAHHFSIVLKADTKRIHYVKNVDGQNQVVLDLELASGNYTLDLVKANTNTVVDSTELLISGNEKSKLSSLTACK
jgi:hypothetical protein